MHPKVSVLIKPEYLWQPRILLRRLLPRQGISKEIFLEYRLPWGLPIRAYRHESQGNDLMKLGVIDLPVTELLWRLIDPGETVIDVGANMGYMTSIFVAKVSHKSGGRVYGYEPNPFVFELLEHNARMWQVIAPNTKIELRCLAISEESGYASLAFPYGYENNKGLSRIISDEESCLTSESGNTYQKTVNVKTESLDKLFAGIEEIGVIKVDVEGHEMNVFRGAEGILKRRSVRDIIFEENIFEVNNIGRSLVSMYLKRFGYEIFAVSNTLFGVKLIEIENFDRGKQHRIWQPVSLLATRDAHRVKEKIRAKGWKSLAERGGPSRKSLKR